MKISDLTPEQLEILADNRPDWMANNRISVDVPEDLVKLLEKYHV